MLLYVWRNKMEKEKFYKIDFTKLNDVYNFKMMSKLDYAKEVIREYYKKATCGLYKGDIASDDTVTVFSFNGLIVEISFEWEYLQVFGLTKLEFIELREYYNHLVEEYFNELKPISYRTRKKIYSEKADLIRKAGLWQEYQKYQSAHEISVISYFCKKYKL